MTSSTSDSGADAPALKGSSNVMATTKKPFDTDLIRDLSAAEIPGVQEKMQRVANNCDPEGSADLWAPLLRRADLEQGSILLRLDHKVLVERLGIAADRIDSAARRISASAVSMLGATERPDLSWTRPARKCSGCRPTMTG